MKLDGDGDFAWVVNNPKLSLLASFTNTQTNPNFSIIHLSLIKLRVLIEFMVRSFFLLGSHYRAIRTTRRIKETASGRKALVLANGPSVNILEDQLPSLDLSDVDVFAVNFFPLSTLASKVKPQYLVLSDPLTHPKITSHKNVKLWDWIQNNPDVRLLVPTSWYKTLRSFSQSMQINYFDDRNLIGWSRNVSPTRPRGYGSLTSYKALAFACYAGYSRIGILGFDNSQFRFVYTNKQNQVYQQSNYFYSESTDLELTASLYNGIADYFYDTSNTFAYLRMFSKFPIFNLDEQSLADNFIKVSKLEEF